MDEFNTQQQNSNTPNLPPEQDPKKYVYVWDGNTYTLKKKNTGKKAVALVLALTLLLAAITLAVVVALNRNGSGTGTESTVGSLAAGVTSLADEPETSKVSTHAGTISTNATTGNSLSYQELYEKCSASCATIYVAVRNGYQIGSGFVISKDGYVITNHHVINGYTSITVKFYDGTDYQATLVGSDELTDIAVLKIEATGLTPIALGDSSTVSVGDEVVAIGTPYDLTLAGTFTNGIISGVNRTVQVGNSYGTATKTMTLLQTNSSINPGNSGGPLINMEGQVIGINTLKLMDDYEGIGFAIPITSAVNIINDLMNYGEVQDDSNSFVTATPKLGITCGTVTDEVKTQYSLPDDTPNGVIISSMSRGTAIYNAGVEIYDIITAFDGATITSINDLSEAMSKTAAGKTATITVYRIDRDGNGKYLDFSFKLDSAS